MNRQQTINRIVTLSIQGSYQEADRLLRMLVNQEIAKKPDVKALEEKAEQQRIEQEALRKAIEKGTLAL